MVGSFLTGFLNDASEKIGNRKKEAEDYFQKQMELARTKGVESRLRVNEDMKAGINQARQLQQIGVPTDIVLSIAQQNPDDIPMFHKQVQELQERGVVTDENFFRQLIQVSDQVNPDESIESVFQRIYTPLLNQAEIDANSINSDPGGSIWATMLGHNAMDRASQRLRETEIIDGLSAQDLLNYGSFTPNVGDNTVTMDASLAGQAIRDLRSDEEKELSIPNRTSLMNTFNDILDEEKENWRRETQATDPDNRNPNFTPEVNDELRRKAVDRLSRIYRVQDIEQVEELRRYLYNDNEEETPIPTVEDRPSPMMAPQSPPESPVAPISTPSATPISETQVGAPEALPAAPSTDVVRQPEAGAGVRAVEPVGTVDTPDGPLPDKLPGGETFIGPSQEHPDASIYQLPDGRFVVVRNEDARQWATRIDGWNPETGLRNANPQPGWMDQKLNQ